jgi:hypothetical protein
MPAAAAGLRGVTCVIETYRTRPRFSRTNRISIHSESTLNGFNWTIVSSAFGLFWSAAAKVDPAAVKTAKKLVQARQNNFVRIGERLAIYGLVATKVIVYSKNAGGFVPAVSPTRPLASAVDDRTVVVALEPGGEIHFAGD